MLKQVLTVAGILVGASHCCVAQPAAPEVAAPSMSSSIRETTGTARQQQWLNATTEQRVRLAESLGDEGARVYAKSKGWGSLWNGMDRGIPQGLDQVYRDADGTIHAIEAKGGTSQLGHAYGHPQGTSEWAVESAKRMLRSPKASAAEKTAADAVVKAAARGNLSVHVVRTSHVLGEPTAAVLQQTVKVSDIAQKIAQSALGGVTTASLQTANGTARITDDAVRTAANTSSTTTALKVVAKGAAVAGVAIDGGLRIRDGLETERKFASGEITVREREVSQAKNAAGMAGGWGGATGGAWAAGAAVAPVAAMTGPGAPVVEGVAVVAGGVGGFICGEAAANSAAEWTVNRIHDAGATVGGAASSAWSATAKSAACAWSWATNW